MFKKLLSWALASAILLGTLTITPTKPVKAGGGGRLSWEMLVTVYDGEAFRLQGPDRVSQYFTMTVTSSSYAISSTRPFTLTALNSNTHAWHLATSNGAEALLFGGRRYGLTNAKSYVAIQSNWLPDWNVIQSVRPRLEMELWGFDRNTTPTYIRGRNMPATGLVTVAYDPRGTRHVLAYTGAVAEYTPIPLYGGVDICSGQEVPHMQGEWMIQVYSQRDTNYCPFVQDFSNLVAETYFEQFALETTEGDSFVAYGGPNAMQWFRFSGDYPALNLQSNGQFSNTSFTISPTLVSPDALITYQLQASELFQGKLTTKPLGYGFKVIPVPTDLQARDMETQLAAVKLGRLMIMTYYWPLASFDADGFVTRLSMAEFMAKAYNYTNGGGASGTCPVQFSDLSGLGTSQVDFIVTVCQLGVTKGYPDGTYRPGETVTRWQMALFIMRLHKALGGSEPPAEGAFTDMLGQSFEAQIAVLQLRYLGITKGCDVTVPGAEKFCPNDIVPRWQMALFINRMLGKFGK